MPRIKLLVTNQRTNWTKTPNHLLDTLLPKLKDTELRLILVFLRQTTGWNREGEARVFSYKTLIEKTGRRSEAVSLALKSLKERGLIHITKDSFRIPPRKAK